MVSFVSALSSVFSITAIAAAFSSSAAVNAPEPAPVLKFIYFVPSNVEFDPNAYAAMQTVAEDYSKWNRQYFNGNAPNYKSDYVLGDHTWEWYVYNRDEYNRIYEANMAEHEFYIAMDISLHEVIRKLDADPATDKNLKYIIFMHEHAEREDALESASEEYGAAWMPYENIRLVQTERIRPPLVLANLMGLVFGLDFVGLPGDCMLAGFNNANKTCNYSPSNQAMVLAKYGKFYTGTTGTNLSVRPAPPVCAAKIGDVCTGTNETRSCCPPEAYCQPVSSAEYQCMKRPATCSDQLTDTDYYGNDIRPVYAATPDDCCAQCSQTPGCRAYTYFNAGAPGIDRGTCYLKSLAGAPTKSIGAVSGAILADWSTAPCTAKVGDPCNKNSVNIRGCCPSGSYCMPWSPGNYKCAAIPAQCSAQRMDHAFQGHDMQVVITPTPEQCCDLCSQTPGCKAYTYYASAVRYSVAGSCYLKSDHGAIHWVIGAVSGWAVTPKPCQNKVGDSCAKNPCCPSGSSCVPWGASDYRCATVPSQCSVQKLNLKYEGPDLHLVITKTPDQCCDVCAQTTECKAYTYYASAAGSRPAGSCVLKKDDQATFIDVGAASGSAFTRKACPNKIGDSCAVNACCPADAFCQPTGTNTAQCVKQPAQSGAVRANLDYSGTDIMTITVSSAEKCSVACAQNPKCNVYSYYQIGAPWASAGTCYLKSVATPDFVAMNAVSGSVINRDACDAKMGGGCGSSLCCPQGGYCQPWGNYNYQCLLQPPKCSTPVTDHDYFGNDLKMVYRDTPDACCEACAATPGCKAYTYLAVTQPAPNNGACYLKTSAGRLVAMPGAIAGSML